LCFIYFTEQIDVVGYAATGGGSNSDKREVFVVNSRKRDHDVIVRTAGVVHDVIDRTAGVGGGRRSSSGSDDTDDMGSQASVDSGYGLSPCSKHILDGL